MQGLSFLESMDSYSCWKLRWITNISGKCWSEQGGFLPPTCQDSNLLYFRNSHFPSAASISQSLFKELLSEPKPVAVAKRVTGRVIYSFPQNITVSPSTLEELGWNRYYRLSCRAFRASILGPGIIFSYAGIRRIEIANLTTVIEGVRLGMPADKIRTRLLPRTEWEEAHV